MRGFTLIELVIAIALTAVVASFAVMFVAGPVRAYDSQSRRAHLTESADQALRSLSRDIRRALPNSVRISAPGGTAALEMIESLGAARYRSSGALGNPALELDFSAPDDAFATLGKFAEIARPFDSTGHYLVVYNVGVPGADAYEPGNVITPPGTSIAISDGAPGEDRVTLGSAWRFAFGSPARRVFLTGGPVTFLCDPAGRTLRRYQGYPFAPSQAANDSHAELMANGATAALIADNVAACSVSYAPGTAERSALVTLDLTVESQGERVRLLHQVHVENSP